jgi:hypothetical protein
MASLLLADTTSWMMRSFRDPAGSSRTLEYGNGPSPEEGRSPVHGPDDFPYFDGAVRGNQTSDWVYDDARG